MRTSKNYDLFVTHAWRFHEDWTKFTELMDKVPRLLWRNFSLPWHDPAISPNTEAGGRFIRSSLESQIIPAHVVVLLAGVYEIRSARLWVDMEVEMAKKHNKPIVGMPAINKGTIPDELMALCDASSQWDAAQLIATIDQVRSLPRYAPQPSHR
ncbi:MAG: hypothetical protein A4E19_08825 [Nitrospira sp. SG-bin1]|nr:MAG: hypothetical protein A4E19_08825 [Nitrospira sp. SG-bin1]